MAENFLKKALISPAIVWLGKRKANRHFGKKPILIVGCGRSGTTLLLSILGAHPHIFAIPNETTAFAHWNSKNQPKRLDRLYREFLFNKIPAKADRWCEKTPNHVRHIDRILDYFNGEVQFIHLIRDGRDVMLSRHPDSPKDYWITPQRWVQDVKAGLEFRDHPNVLTVHYENLVRHYTATIEKICDFIGEECTEEMYQWFEHTNVVENRAWKKGVENLHAQSVGKWEKQENREKVEAVMAEPEVKTLLESLGYEI